MPKASVGMAILFGVAFILFGPAAFSGSPQMSNGERIGLIVLSICTVSAALIGGAYLWNRKPIFAWIHSVFMLPLIVASGWWGFSTLTDSNIPGGKGPDANPVGGILYAIALLDCAVAVFGGFCIVSLLTVDDKIATDANGK